MDIYTSDDNNHWKKISVINYLMNGPVTDVFFDVTTCKYIKFILTKDDDSKVYYWSIQELSIWGK